jgi:transcriptional regulator with XRE-family HTH domain
MKFTYVKNKRFTFVIQRNIMKERIIEFLKAENKSSAQFAQEIGVQPSSISHIISGRNNPSLDFVMKMLSKYPSLSADWLLFGKGQMLRENPFGDLFSLQPVQERIETVKTSENKLRDSSKTTENIKNEMPIGETKEILAQYTKAKKIICFFDNNTFTEYFPSRE